MLGDVFNKLSAAQTLTASAVSTNVIDLLSRKDIGPGTCIGMAFTVDVTPTAAYNQQAVTATNATDIITLAAHGLLVGDMVTLDGTPAGTAGTVPTGLEFGRIYFVTNPTANTFQLSTTLAIAKSGVADGLFTADGANLGLTVHPTVEFQTVVGDLNTLAETNRPLQVLGTSGPIPLRMPRRTVYNVNDTLTTTGHGLETGTPILLSGSALPSVTGTALAAGTVYYAVVTSTSAFKLARTPQDALAGNVIDITGTGTQPLYWQVADYNLVAAKTLVKVETNPSNELFIPNRYLGARYLGARYLVTGKLTAPAMAVSAMPVIDEAYPLSPTTYPSGWSV